VRVRVRSPESSSRPSARTDGGLSAPLLLGVAVDVAELADAEASLAGAL
jgi:hypothetical protein